jgi:hypothetical protein
MNGNGSNGTAGLFYPARPIINVDGQVERDLGEILLVDLLVEETTLGLFRCEARFTNWEPGASSSFRFFNAQVFDFGKDFAVEMGRPNEVRTIFDGRIMGLEAQFPAGRAPELVVLAEDRFQDLRMTRRTRTFDDASDSDIVQQIASDQGLQADVDVDGPQHKVMTQLNQSDLAFLRERAAAVDAELWIEGSTLHFQARSRRDAGTVHLSYGGNLREFTVLADLAHQRSKVKVSGWDVENKEAIDEEAGEDSISGELEGLRSGSEMLEQALATRDERIILSTPISQDEATALAKAEYRRRARRFVTGSGVADGEAAIRVGGRVEMSGLGSYFDGVYYVRQARHVFDLLDGHRTLFEVERPGMGSPA